MKLSTEQRAALDRLTELSDRYALDRKLARRRLAERLETELTNLARLRSRAANEALALGVSKTQIGNAVGTRDWKTVSGILNLTADEREIVAEVVKPKSWWILDKDAMTVTLSEWGGGETGWPEETGEYVVQVILRDGEWDLNLEQKRPAAVSLTMYRTVLPLMNNQNVVVVNEPTVSEPPTIENYGYAPPHAWTPEDDEKDASEW